ncbi:GAF domain-containing protein [Cytophagaceae bacterium ABcell3]|nr:GAF domain-containing protein [Cytophagaceae bacterium ABcell3]
MSSPTLSILNNLREQGIAVDWQQLLSNVISSFDCSTGTIHMFDHRSKLLKLQAQQGIPDFLLPKMQEIPVGKGMAGVAAERRKPVEMCNLQTDASGVARPAARETKVEGSIAVPMLYDGALYGTLGIAKPVAYDFTDDEKESLMRIGEEISYYIRTNPQ